MNLINKLLYPLNLKLRRIFPRAMIRQLDTGKPLVGVEIGIYKGENALSILKTLNIKRLYLIDPYDLYDDYKDRKLNYGISQMPLKGAEKIAKKRLESYSSKITWIKKKSENALLDIPNELDFVYIDGNHTYKYVIKDIENYWKKLREGGIIGGHDIENGSCSEHDGVLKAFMEFARGRRCFVETPDWWIVKEHEK